MRLTALFLAVACAPCAAEPLDWIKGQSEMTAVTTLANGIAWGNLCDRPINLAIASRYLSAGLGANRQFSPSQAADLMFMVSGMIALQRSFTGGIDCPNAERLFGPKGSSIPGLFNR